MKGTGWSWSGRLPVAEVSADAAHPGGARDHELDAGDRGLGDGGDRVGWRRGRLEASRLYVVTGARRDRRDLAAFQEAIHSAGVDIVPLRRKEVRGGHPLRRGQGFTGGA